MPDEAIFNNKGCKFGCKQKKRAENQLFLLTRQGSNLDSSGPKPDVLPITPRVNHYCLLFKDSGKSIKFFNSQNTFLKFFRLDSMFF